MELKNQCCTLEQAMRLKGLGIKQDSFFSWYYCTDRDDEPALNKSSQYNCPTCGHPSSPYFAESSAFTAAELGAMLPDEVRTSRCKEAWLVYIEDELFVPEHDDTEAEARADYLIYLLETGSASVDEINSRLCPER